MGVGRKSVDLGIALVKRSGLALQVKQEGLELVERPAFNAVPNLATSCVAPDSPCLRSRETNRQLCCAPSACRFSANDASTLRIDR